MNTPLSPLAVMLLTMAQQDKALRSARALWDASPHGVSRKAVDEAMLELAEAGWVCADSSPSRAFWLRDEADRAAHLGQREFAAMVIAKLGTLGVKVTRDSSVTFSLNMHNALRLLIKLSEAKGDLDPAIVALFQEANYNDPSQYDLSPESGADRY